MYKLSLLVFNDMIQKYLGSDMTTYCELALKMKPGLDVERTLSLFAVEQCNAREAVPIDSTQYNIDNGLNDLRAVLKPEIGLITFCCRYSQDVPGAESKVQAFSQKHDLETARYAK